MDTGGNLRGHYARSGSGAGANLEKSSLIMYYRSKLIFRLKERTE